MDWTNILIEIVKATPELATVALIVFLFVYTTKQQRKTETRLAEDFAQRFAKQQDDIEKEFRQFLMQRNDEFMRIIREYTQVLKEFQKTQEKTNTILLQNTETNRMLHQVLNEHLVAWNLKTLKEK